MQVFPVGLDVLGEVLVGREILVQAVRSHVVGLQLDHFFLGRQLTAVGRLLSLNTGPVEKVPEEAYRTSTKFGALQLFSC